MSACACTNLYECPHACWNCHGEGTCEVWCHIETFPAQRTDSLLPGPAPADAPAAPVELVGKFYEAIERAVGEHREMTGRWDESDGTTEAIAQAAARAAGEVAGHELRALRERVAQLQAACQAADRERPMQLSSSDARALTGWLVGPVGGSLLFEAAEGGGLLVRALPAQKGTSR